VDARHKAGQDESIYRLTDDQVEEVRRRRADKNAPKLTLDEFKERLRRRETEMQGVNCSARHAILPL
jgi:DNA-binding PadR family transcriptional regulator